MTDELPESRKYTVGSINFDPSKTDDNFSLKETYIFDITQEADYLTGSCTELHLIVSAPDWESLQIKMNNVYFDKVMEDEKNG